MPTTEHTPAIRIVTTTPSPTAAVNIIETNVFGAIAHHGSCTVTGCGWQSARRDSHTGKTHTQVIDLATQHAKTHTDAQDIIDNAGVVAVWPVTP